MGFVYSKKKKKDVGSEAQLLSLSEAAGLSGSCTMAVSPASYPAGSVWGKG